MLVDEHTFRQLETAHRRIERERQWRKRLSLKARKVVRELEIENARLKALVISEMREDD